MRQAAVAAPPVLASAALELGVVPVTVEHALVIVGCRLRHGWAVRAQLRVRRLPEDGMIRHDLTLRKHPPARIAQIRTQPFRELRIVEFRIDLDHRRPITFAVPSVPAGRGDVGRYCPGAEDPVGVVVSPAHIRSSLSSTYPSAFAPTGAQRRTRRTHLLSRKTVNAPGGADATSGHPHRPAGPGRPSMRSRDNSSGGEVMRRLRDLRAVAALVRCRGELRSSAARLRAKRSQCPRRPRLGERKRWSQWVALTRRGCWS